MANHAYAFKKVGENAEYVELVNPWDDADCIRLPFNLYIKYFDTLRIYNEDTTELKTRIDEYIANNSTN